MNGSWPRPPGPGLRLVATADLTAARQAALELARVVDTQARELEQRAQDYLLSAERESRSPVPLDGYIAHLEASAQQSREVAMAVRDHAEQLRALAERLSPTTAAPSAAAAPTAVVPVTAPAPSRVSDVARVALGAIPH